MDLISKNKKVLSRKNIIIFSVLFILLILSSIYFITNFRSVYRSGQLRIHHRNQESLPNKINNIRAWMTFDYLNVVFKLSPDYFKNNLSITDPKYPNIRIDRYAMNQGIKSQELLYKIQQLISKNLNGGI